MSEGGDASKAPLSDLGRMVADPGFLAALCHDLRGPLGAIGTWIHILASGRADPATHERAFAAMKRDVDAQSRLVEQLAHLSTILRGTLRPCVEELDLLGLFDELGAEAQAGAAPRVVADRALLRQLLAIFLPERGSTPSRAALVAENDAGGALSIRGQARVGGPGLLGLTLARALAEIQGAELEVAPAADVTTFTIRLPARAHPV